ncbi:amino acid ABC transporter permease [Psychromicrobium lacuslunae]|uniref:Amino acid ABC transporter permease n=1 Tax=Psychromicrobium lacuslunae TaxID=1618207 RepID=A0A0D4BZK6_9MICC|nr:amino acid ABC transporter permease [Psychromicrobium lacuslunae]AJT41526.1 amino acid ABC transporter permease [Psychromicrobium lacuslunae]
MNTFFDFQAMAEVVPELLLVGLPNTLIFAFASGILGTLLGVLLAVMGISHNRLLRYIARIYTDIFRGLPAVVVIVLFGLALAPVFQPFFGRSPYPTGILALSLMSAAYIGEIFRSGIQSVEKGQLEASRALGFGYGPAMRLVVIPQGIRRVLPALMNQFIILIKDSSLVFFLGLLANQRDVFRIGNDAAANTGNYSPVVAAGVLYLVLTIPLTHLVNYVDKRLRTGRAEQGNAATTATEPVEGTLSR